MKLAQHLLFTLLLSLCTFTSFAGQFNSIVNIGDSMPAFEALPSTSEKSISSQDLSEDVIVFVSLANHCPWVLGMDKDLVDLANQFKDKNVRIIGLSMNHRKDDRLPAMKEHANKVGYSFDYLYDESQSLGRALGATRTPEYFVFNKDRKLIYTGALYNSPAKMNKDGSIKYINGEPSEFYVQNALLAGLDNKQVTPAETRAHGCTVKYVQ